MKPLALSLLPALALGALAACGSTADPSEDGELRIVATTAIIGELARQVAGEDAKIDVLVTAGADPHEYELTAEDLKNIDRADVILRNGIGLDAFLDKAIKGKEARAHTVTEGIELRHADEADGHEDEDADPHVWHSPANDQVMVANIAEALANVDEENATTYLSAAASYNKTLDETDKQIRALIDSIPAANRKVVTNHDSIGYFIDRYGLVYVGAVIPSLTTQSEPSAKEIAELEDTIRREGVKAIFAESSVDPKVAQQVAKDTGVKIVDDLYGDTLGDPGSGAETVHGMLLANATKIAEALR